MGRDRVLPRVFAKITPNFATPVVSIVTIGIVGLIALAMDVTTSTSFINFGAFIAFTMVNVSVLSLLTQLDINAITLGTTWLVVGVIILAVLTRGFRIDPPETVEELAGEFENADAIDTSEVRPTRG